jgi:hypothetical protein
MFDLQALDLALSNCDSYDPGILYDGNSPKYNTPRLLLPLLQLTDAPAIQRLFPHWEMVHYLDSRMPWPYLEEGALTHVRDIALAAIGAGREWHWIIYLPVGTWAYRPADNDNYGKSSQIQA